jgi:hypothetical protein
MAQLLQQLLFSLKDNNYQYKIYQAGSSVFIEDIDYDPFNSESTFIEIDLDEWKQISNFINNEIKNIGNEI